MVRYSILNLAAIATLLLGAEAGPCRPRQLSRQALWWPRRRLLLILRQRQSIRLLLRPRRILPLGYYYYSSGRYYDYRRKSTTTTAAAACAETQLFINPGFDDSPSGIAPWTSNANLIQSQAQSGTNALSAVFSNGQPDYYFKQTLQNLNGDYEFSYYYRVVSVSPGADYVCNIELKVGDTSKFGAMYDSAGGWRSDSVSFSIAGGAIAQADVQLILTCYGEFVRIEVNIDTLAFTRVCSA
ncbi:hypothetical protein NW765_015089 [Fusarium oxysporum]|nr:hypothetical protein NW765_015089 [Fusarium oxysporum]